MGYQLRRAIRDALPSGLLTQGERAVLLELADYANENTRRAWPGMDELARASDMTPDSVGKCLQRMAKKGIEVRVALGTDRRGRLIYAHSGKQSSYLLPEPFDLKKVGPPSDQKPGQESDQNREEGRTTVPGRSDHGSLKVGPPSDPSPQGTLKEPPTPSVPSSVAGVPDGPGSGQGEEEDASQSEDQARIEVDAAAVVADIPHELGPLDRARLTVAVAQALTAGHTPDVVGKELAKSTAKLDSVIGGLLGRMKKLTTTAPAPEPSPRSADIVQPCPLHANPEDTQPQPVLNCNTCWMDVKCKEDPYEGREGKRPEGWFVAYRTTPEALRSRA